MISEVFLSGLGKYNKKGWFDCILIKENYYTKIVSIPELKSIAIKVKNDRIRKVADINRYRKEEDVDALLKEKVADVSQYKISLWQRILKWIKLKCLSK